MSAQRMRPGPALKSLPEAEEKFNLKKVFDNPNAYEFKCESVLIIPELQIIEKQTGKLMTKLGNMRVVKHAGTMNQKYADEFFIDIQKEAMPAFIRQVSEGIKKRNSGLST